jgi:hypothetical protein
LTAIELRKFGLTVGGVFLLIAAYSLWRDRDTVAMVAGGMGGVLAGLGAVAPTLLGPAYRGWMGLALLLSRVTTPIFMGIVYFVVITPIALIMRGLGRNPLLANRRDGSAWAIRPEGERRSDLERQF